ncbi:MAG: ribonucleotide-diphosphate reductase subunit beta [Rickettsiales bacterium]
MSLLDAAPIYKPFHYPWAYEAWHTQQKIHWLPEEVPLGDDVKDWKYNLTESERNLLTQIFRFFTQADIEVNNCYMRQYSRVFKPTEVQMMLSAFSNMETVHIAAYSHLLDTIGMPEIEYSAFLTYKEMKDKYDYMQRFHADDAANIAKTLAVFGAFTEGLQLFASFAILLNFPRFNKMKGMGQVVTWSVRDETLHTNSIIRLFKTFISENPFIWTEELKEEIGASCDAIIAHEDAFINLAFEMGEVQGLTPEQVKDYIRFIGNRRLTQLGLPTRYSVHKNPLPWIDEILNGVEHANFFENRVTEYAKAATEGSWDDVFSEMDVMLENRLRESNRATA